MADNTKELEQRIEELKSKCNRQVDFINQQKEEILFLQQSNRFLELFKLYYFVVCELIKRDAFYFTKKSTENTRKYKFAENSIVKGILSKTDTKLQQKYIFEKWVVLGLIGTDASGQITYNFSYNGRATRCIRFSKAVVELVKECLLYES